MAAAPAGIEPCRKPLVFEKMRSLRGCIGLAGAFSGRAALIFSSRAGLILNLVASSDAPGWPQAAVHGRANATKQRERTVRVMSHLSRQGGRRASPGVIELAL